MIIQRQNKQQQNQHQSIHLNISRFNSQTKQRKNNQNLTLKSIGNTNEQNNKMKEQQIKTQFSPTRKQCIPNQEIQFKPRKRSINRFSVEDFQCPLCSNFIEIQQATNITLCKHKFCANCSLKFIKFQVENFNRVQCPIKDCGAFIDGKSVILSYLTADQLEKLNRVQKAQGNQQIKSPMNKRVQQIKNGQMENKLSDLANRAHREQIENMKNKQKIMKKTVQCVGENEIVLSSSQSSPRKTGPQKIGSLLDSQVYLNHQNLDNLPSKIQQAKFSQQKNKQNQTQIFPQKIFAKLCTQIWSNKWFNFFKIFPISVVLMVVFFVIVILWMIWVILYFILVWILFVPFVWSIYQILGCFTRSFKNNKVSKILFIISLISFPPLIIFFYFLIVSIIIYDTLFRLDMKEILEGKISILLSCRKLYMDKRDTTKQPCSCQISDSCQKCKNRKRILCFLF